MTPTKVPYLCGGILFSLLLQARKTRTKARDKLKGGSDGLKDTDVMMGLVEVVTGDCFDSAQGKTFGKCTTQFKTCQDYGTTYIPFTDPSVISSFNSLVNKKAPAILNRMTGFIDKFINNAKAEWLVKAILEVIQCDKEIDNDTLFDITLRETISKKNLNNITEIELPVFLLSVLDFIINKRQDNKKGRPTFEAWHNQAGKKSAWKFVSSIGTSDERNLNVRVMIEVSSATTIDNNGKTAENENPLKTPKERIEDKLFASGNAVDDAWEKTMEFLADDMENNNAHKESVEYTESDFLDDTESSNATKEETHTTIIQNQVNVVQNGSNNVSMTNTGNITFNFGGDNK